MLSSNELGIIKVSTLTDVAICCAQLVREGVTFEVNESRFGWTITLTGGY